MREVAYRKYLNDLVQKNLLGKPQHWAPKSLTWQTVRSHGGTRSSLKSVPPALHCTFFLSLLNGILKPK